MRIWRGLGSIIKPFHETSLAIGVFDGIHLGHQTLIRMTVEDAHRSHRPSAVLTFDRHPAELVAPDKVPGLLTTESQRIRLFESLGLDELVIARFDGRFRELSPEAFLHFVVSGVLGARSVFVGYDFRFGRDQAGNTDFLKASCGKYDVRVHVMEPVLVNGERASSSSVRDAVLTGRVDDAARMLGRLYSVRGTVVRGEQLGRKLGFPTANLQHDPKQLLPRDGIYAVWVHHGDERRRGACSIGFRPTVGGAERTLEVYILDFEGDLYGAELDLEFAARLRDEVKFESVEALTAQMRSDVQQAEVILGPL